MCIIFSLRHTRVDTVSVLMTTITNEYSICQEKMVSSKPCLKTVAEFMLCHDFTDNNRMLFVLNFFPPPHR